MNKKLLFAAMSFAALTACSTDDFESQQQVAEGVSPIQFEVINNDGNITRASMGGTDNNTISWSAKDGDLFTLYFGASSDPYKSGYDNATYTAKAEDGEPATLTTPTMIKEGQAIMYWPVDTTFRINTGDNLTIKIPVEQVNTADEIPYVSDRITIGAYTGTKHKPADYNTAGYDRKYPVYMRPMASQLNLKADYAGTDAKIAELYTGDDPIDKIQVTSIDLLTSETGGTLFTKEIPVQFGATNPAWTAVENNAFSAQTQFDVASIVAGTGDGEGQTAKLTAKDKCLLPNNVGAKILILPQSNITGGVANGAVVVNTIYGKVYVAAHGVGDSKYTVDEAKDAWARYIKQTTHEETYEEKAGTAEADGENKGKYKTTSSIADGMMQTINAFSGFTAPTGTKVIAGEQMGTAVNRYVKVLLTHLDMSDLHVKSDKQLYDVVRVWKKMGLDDVEVILDGDATNKEFEISQKTIETINTINAASTKKFAVKPCIVEGEKCETIVITGEGDVKDLTFIKKNGTKKADVAFNAGETWNWKGDVKVTANQINSFINRGTMQNAESATLRVMSSNGTYQQFNVPFENAEGATWNITAGTLRVQFNVTNNGTVNISKGAQYLQDGQDVAARKTTFTNEATDKPSRFGGNDSKIGKVENKGVFATIGGADINNYGLIEHADKDAKTYITSNQKTGNFGAAFAEDNKMGRINLPYGNKDEDNISINAAAEQGFVSVTVNGEDDDLDEDEVGTFVNYIIVKSGVKTISELPAQIKYVEFNQPNTEIEWAVAEAGYDGLMVLSPVNIKLGTKVAARVTYIGSEMYVGGTFNKDANVTIDATDYPATVWNGYYGNTTTAVATKYITF